MSFNEMTYGFNDNKPNAMRFSDENMEGDIVEQSIDDSIYILKTRLNLSRDIKLDSSSRINGVMIGYNLHGYSEHKGKSSDHHICLATYDSNMSIIKDDDSTSFGPKGTICKINCVIKADYIKKNITDNRIRDYILSSLESDIGIESLFKRKFNTNINLILNDIYKLPFDGSLNNIYLQSKVLELIYHEFASLVKDKKNFKNNIKLNDYDIEAIKRAKNILLQNLENPPSIIELARMVCINDFKLKKGFKQMFQTTPYNLLIDYKLELAKKLLQKGDMNIKEISQYIGYTYSQSFSAAFSKKFGVRPKDVIKSREYYY